MRKKFLYLCLVFLLGIGIFFSFKARNNYLEKRKVAWKALEAKIHKELDHFDGEASIVIKDLRSGGKILLNPDKSFPSASLVKIPIMAVCFYAADEGKIKLDEMLRLKASHKASGVGRLKEAAIGAEFSVERLIELMISESDNTAANILIERLGFGYLNDCFKKLGLSNTNIARRMMDFQSRKEGKENFTTASDLSFLLEGLYKNRLIKKVYSQTGLEFLKRQKIRDRIPAKLPRSTVVAHKTGLEKGICHDVGVVFTSKGDFLICVLIRHNNKHSQAAKKFIAQVALGTYNYYQSL